MLVDIMRSALGQGIYLTPPASGTPGAAALDEIAKQCQKPVDEIRSAMDTLTLARPVSSARQSFKSLDGKDQGSLFAVTVSPAGQLPEALGCVASARSEPLRLDLFVNGRDLGPLESVVVPASLQGKIQADVNSIYGDTARPWRLATAEELLAILPVLFNYSLWGPDGGKFWTSVRLADGSHAMLVTKISRRYYDVSIEIADAVQKATAIWVRNRSN